MCDGLFTLYTEYGKLWFAEGWAWPWTQRMCSVFRPCAALLPRECACCMWHWLGFGCPPSPCTAYRKILWCSAAGSVSYDLGPSRQHQEFILCIYLTFILFQVPSGWGCAGIHSKVTKGTTRAAAYQQKHKTTPKKGLLFLKWRNLEGPPSIFQDDLGLKTNVSVLSFYVGYTFRSLS